MARGEPFSSEQLDRLNRARRAAEDQTGVRFDVRVGQVEGDVPAAADAALAQLTAGSSAPAVLVLVSPGQRFVHIATNPAGRRRVDDAAAALAVLAMTSSFALGDIVGGLVNGLRQLADAAGAAATGPGVPSRHSTTALVAAH